MRINRQLLATIAISSQILYSSLFPILGWKNSSFKFGRDLVIIVNIQRISSNDAVHF
jgi:hypothetical protein